MKKSCIKNIKFGDKIAIDMEDSLGTVIGFGIDRFYANRKVIVVSFGNPDIVQYHNYSNGLRTYMSDFDLMENWISYKNIGFIYSENQNDYGFWKIIKIVKKRK